MENSHIAWFCVKAVTLPGKYTIMDSNQTYNKVKCCILITMIFVKYLILL